MNIHEYQAKGIFKQFGIPVLNGVAVLDLKDIIMSMCAKFEGCSYGQKSEIRSRATC